MLEKILLVANSAVCALFTFYHFKIRIACKFENDTFQIAANWAERLLTRKRNGAYGCCNANVKAVLKILAQKTAHNNCLSPCWSEVDEFLISRISKYLESREFWWKATHAHRKCSFLLFQWESNGKQYQIFWTLVKVGERFWSTNIRQ